MIDFISKMKSIGEMYESDKITVHKYHEIYGPFLKDIENSENGMIELGLEQNSSLNMWLELFPQMFIYGVDIKSKNEIKERYSIFQADQSNEKNLDNFIKQINHKIVFINDDASHIPEFQLLTFNKLFPMLEIGGVYVIEDIEVSYWKTNGLYGYKTKYGYKHKNSIVEIFKNALDCVNLKYMNTVINTPVQHLENIASITFGRNCIIITKKQKEDQKPYMFEYNL